MTPSRNTIIAVLTEALRRILIFRGKEEEAEAPIPTNLDPVKSLGVPSDDLILVGPELSRESTELDLPNEVFDWADDSSGQRRYRTVEEMADRIIKYLASQEAAKHE